MLDRIKSVFHLLWTGHCSRCEECVCYEYEWENATNYVAPTTSKDLLDYVVQINPADVSFLKASGKRTSKHEWGGKKTWKRKKISSLR